MKKIVISLCLALALVSCDSTKPTTTAEATITSSPQPPVSVTTGTKIEKPAAIEKPKRVSKTMLLGVEERASLEAMPFGTWFNANYAKYTPSQDKISAIKQGLNGVTLTTFMGTWCGDSKRETPRMYKILDAADFKGNNVNLITVDRSKQKPTELTAGKNIKRVPTFIFMKDGEELGRIVERPIESLEADMLKILNGEPYKHAYEN